MKTCAQLWNLHNKVMVSRWSLDKSVPIWKNIKPFLMIHEQNIFCITLDFTEQNHKSWTPTHGHTRVCCLAKSYTHQLCMNTGCHLKDLPRMMAYGKRDSNEFVLSAHPNDNDKCLYIYIYIYIYVCMFKY